MSEEPKELTGEYGSLAAPALEEVEIPLPKITTTVLYKSASGELKELRIVQPVNPDQLHLTFDDIRLLAREISKVLKEDS